MDKKHASQRANKTPSRRSISQPDDLAQTAKSEPELSEEDLGRVVGGSFSWGVSR
jgi:hypothetical protein